MEKVPKALVGKGRGQGLAMFKNCRLFGTGEGRADSEQPATSSNTMTSPLWVSVSLLASGDEDTRLRAATRMKLKEMGRCGTWTAEEDTLPYSQTFLAFWKPVTERRTPQLSSEWATRMWMLRADCYRNAPLRPGYLLGFSSLWLCEGALA